jgi:hypothetical protein
MAEAKNIRQLQDQRAQILKEWTKLTEEVLESYASGAPTVRAKFVERAKHCTTELIGVSSMILANTQHAQFAEAIELSIKRNLLTKVKQDDKI